MAEEQQCSGICLSGYDVGVPSSQIAYAHPECPAHGGSWVPHDNDWSRKYVAEHPERFGGSACSRCGKPGATIPDPCCNAPDCGDRLAVSHFECLPKRLQEMEREEQGL